LGVVKETSRVELDFSRAYAAETSGKGRLYLFD
jgi:hypothetical protein